MPIFNAVVTFTVQVRAEYAVEVVREESAREAIKEMAKEDAQSIGLAIEREELITDGYDVQEVKIKVETFEERNDAN
jgi:rRNA maturation endonuclease Nob1